MGVALRDFTEAKLYPIAVLISLSKSELHITPGTNKATPPNEWLADQYRRVPGLPQHLLVPPILPTGATIRASQMVKRVIMAASGGADAVAAKAAANGIPLSDLLQPHTTPTVLCHAHKKLHPTLIREIFHYITKEVADYADPIRRHPRHAHPGGDASSKCQSKEVRDWSYRMMGLSALWSTRQTFRCLEKGRQAPAPGHAASKSKSSSHRRKHSTTKAAPESEGASRSHSSSHHRVRSHMRMPHMKFPCEACIVAIIGTHGQALIDLRAGMLSRMCADNADGVLRAKRHSKEDKKPSSRHKTASTATAASDTTTSSSSSFKPKTFPHLWALLDVYINAFGHEDADEIRSRSEKLAMMLLVVRICETKRRRDQRDDDSRIRDSRRHRSHRSHSHSHRHRDNEPESSSVPPFVRVKQPPRMVTKNGHRLPLPLLPPKLDPWAKHHATECGAATEADEGPAEDNYEGYADGYIDADGAFYAANQDLEQSASIAAGGSQIMTGGPNEDGEAEYFYVAPDDDEDDGDDEDHSAFLAGERCDLAAAMQGSVPAWEDDYQHHVIDTQSEMTYSAAPAQAQTASSRLQSFVSVTVHSEADVGTDSEAELDPFHYDYGSFGRYGAAAPARLSTIKDDPVSEVSAASASQVPIPSVVSATESYRSSTASRQTVRSRPDPYSRPSNPEPPSSTVSRASRSSRVSSHATQRTASTAIPSVARKPVPSRATPPKTTSTASREPLPTTPATPLARKPVPSRATSSVPRKPAPPAPKSPMARKPVPSAASSRPPSTRHEQRPPSSIYSMSNSRHSSRLTSTPSSPTSHTTTTSSSSRRTPSSATSASNASASTIKASSAFKRLPSTPLSSSSSVSSRLTRPTQSSSRRQSAASTSFDSPSHRRPSAPESYVAMQNSMSRASTSSVNSSRYSKTTSSVTVQAKASGPRVPPSEVSACSTLSSLYSGYAGNGISDEIYNCRGSGADSVVPDDSISVVMTKKLLDEEQANWEEAQREKMTSASHLEGDGTIRSPEEIKWLQNLLKYAEPQRSRASSVASKMAPSAMPPPLFTEKSSLASEQRNLNHYAPSLKRRPVGAPSSRVAEPAPSQASRSKPSRSKPSRSKPSLPKPPQPKPAEPKPAQPKPQRARHRHPSGLSDRSNLTVWPPVVWK